MRHMVGVWAFVLVAQTPSFDAASIRKSIDMPGQEGARRGVTTTPAGVTARQSNLRDCIQWAWTLRDYQLTGPDWINVERYDISTRTATPSSPEDLRAMMRSLIIERFQLRLRR